MKVTFVLEGADLSGGTRVVAEHAKRLKARGHEVTVVSTPYPELSLRNKLSYLAREKRWPAARRSEATHLDGTGVPHIRLERHRSVTAADVPDADVIVATTWRTGHWIFEMPRSKGAKAHFMQHHEIWMGWDGAEGCPAAWRLPSHKIVISKWLAKLCKEEYGQDSTHVPNAVDTELFFAPVRGKQPVPTVGFLYSPIGFKGVEVALRAIELLRERMGGEEKVRVVAFGREEESAALPLPKGAHYERLPAQGRLRELYGMCDLWLCGSRAEGFHLPPLEAMACRCPVVSTRVGGPEDVVEEGVNGHLVEVGDSEGLADRAARVLSLDEAGWRAMSDAAYRTAHAYSWDDAVELFERGLERATREQAMREQTLAGGPMVAGGAR